MKMDDFLKKVKEQLKNMSEEEKDTWIISQAKTVSEWEQEDFYKSICGTKKIIYMPEKQEIDKFCEQAENGEIVIEYETHYVEFDDMGFYHDDWEQTYHDPSYAMIFLSKIFRGCHDLVILEDYILSYEILERVLKIRFQIVDHPDTDDCCEEEFFELYDGVKNGILYINCKQILQDYLISCQEYYKDKKESPAKKMASVLEMSLFEDILPSQCLDFIAQDSLISDLINELKLDLAESEKTLDERLKADPYYVGEYRDKTRIKRIRKIIEDLNGYGNKKKKEPISFLRGSWKQISELLKALSYEPYIDDQWQIEEIWNICQALIKRGRFEEEPWDVKEQILRKIYENGLYNEYGCYDPMNDLAEALCVSDEENLCRAQIMKESGEEKMAAELYRELGQEDKCVEYYEKHLGKNCEAYEIVMNYYKERNYEKAIEVAELALEKCKDDQTPFIIFLMEDSERCGDEKRFQKLNKSAHMRKAVDSDKVDEYFGQTLK